MFMRNHKYKISPPEERKYLGRTFGSKAEMRYCQNLQLLVEGNALEDYVCQPKVWLGVPENIYVPDFLVIPKEELPYYVDVKGMETQKFKRDKKLWASYGRLPLVIVKESSPAKFKTKEVICERGNGSSSNINVGRQ